MVPLFCALVYVYTPERDWARLAALFVYVVAAMSDVVDGYIARHWDQRTSFGTRLDPLADKWLVNLGFVFIAANIHFVPGIPLWFPVVVLARDILLVMAAWLVHEYYHPVQVRPRLLGKLTTFCQVCTFVVVLMQWWFAPLFIYATVILIVLSATDYIAVNVRQLERKGAT